MQLSGHRQGKALPFPAGSLSASFFSAEELTALKSKVLLKAGLRDSQNTLMATKMLPNDASSGAGEKKVVLRIENSNSPKLGIKAVHVIVVCTTRMGNWIQPLIV